MSEGSQSFEGANQPGDDFGMADTGFGSTNNEWILRGMRRFEDFINALNFDQIAERSARSMGLNETRS